jgi:hypothetical protein
MENKTLDTVLTAGAFVIGVLGLILGIMIMSGNEAVIGTAITLTLVLMGIAAGVAVIFGSYFLLTNIKKNMPLLLGLVGFVVIAFICYALASDEVLRTYDDSVTASSSQLSGAGLMVMYVLILAALAAAVIGEVLRIFK